MNNEQIDPVLNAAVNRSVDSLKAVGIPDFLAVVVGCALNGIFMPEADRLG